MQMNIYMDNITLSEDAPTTVPASVDPKQEVLLTDVVIADENVALNVIVSFLNTAQRRGAYSIAESAKIFECVNMFVKTPASTA